MTTLVYGQKWLDKEEALEILQQELGCPRKAEREYERQRASANAVSSVYFLQNGNHIKIGFSKNVKARVASLQTASASKLVVIFSEPGSKKDEARYHSRFRTHRVSREWFRREGALKRFLAERAGGL